MSSTLGEFAAVIFDFDGTLADSHAAMVRSYLTWADEFGLDPASLVSFTGMPSAAIAAALLPADQVERASARIDELEVADTDGVVPLPGAVDALAGVPDERRAIATSCTAPLLNARLDAVGLDRPAVVVTRDDVTNGKPDPESFLLAAERLGTDPERCVVFEDAPAGVAAARAAGMAVIGVLTAHTVDELQADWHVNSLADVEFEAIDDGVRITWRA
ncbi:HAD-IA family hydrolase [Tessaracoccus flavus]|uniref:HAD-IA family hydrolase n=1 Tax=Tessaracoccus flavus TaxID=1610493 RepID=UPI000899DB3A|nr:HAD-IA family hydrolase [Tessaracoccus flavus]SDY78892.1 sugar-phosphatase [Tessaracoccus flavus]